MSSVNSLQRSLPLLLVVLLCSWRSTVMASAGFDIAVEYSDPDVQYFGQWEVTGKPPNDSTITVSESASAQLAFTGTAVAVYGLIDPNAFQGGYNFTVDNVLYAQFSTSANATSPYSSSPCDPYVLFNATDLPEGPHVIQVVNNIPDFLGYLALKRFIYFDPEAPGPVPAITCVTRQGPGLGGLIAGATVGGIAGVVLIVLIVLGWRRQRRERGLSSKPPPYSRDAIELGSTHSDVCPPSAVPPAHRAYRLALPRYQREPTRGDPDSPPAYETRRQMVVVVS